MLKAFYLFSLSYLDGTNSSTVWCNSNFLYWNLHYHNLYNFCINVVIYIPNEEVGGARNVYVKKLLFLFKVPTIK